VAVAAALVLIVAAVLVHSLKAPSMDTFLTRAGRAAEEGKYDQAVENYRQAAALGSTRAKFELGVIYYAGPGEIADAGQAFGLFNDVAEQGLPAAQINLGTMYASGRGVEQDLEKAHALFQQAADQKMTLADYYLALDYLSGWGTTQRTDRAFELAKSASDAGLGQGQYLLGLLYTNGLGTAEDDLAAGEMYALAAANDVKKLDVTLYIVDWDGRTIAPKKRPDDGTDAKES
ncbi:MAG: sel1 repeat family protein, partial [Deltaproteobacteria bacterium]|nr:sel1 repeat family protein [Deltaproteobacteria bacterium]